MLRVLKLTTYDCSCGIATYAQNLVSGLSSIGCEVEVYPLPERKDLVDFDDDDITEILDRFVDKAIRYRYDAVHIQHEYGLFMGGGEMADSIIRFGYLLKRLNKAKVRTIVTFHTGPEIFYEAADMWRTIKRDWGFIVDRLLTRIWNREVVPWFQPRYDCSAIVHVNNTRKHMLHAGIHPDNVTVVPHGVIDRRLEFTPIDPAGVVNLSIFGFISSYKGYHTAMRALRLLPDNYTLTCMGGRHPNSKGSEYTDILEFATNLDRERSEHRWGDVYTAVKNRIRITGFLTEQQADAEHGNTQICLVPYEAENFSGSGALTWSMTSGKPVIASNIPAFETLNEEHRCMHLFNREEPEELAWAIKRVVNDVELQRSLTRNASKYCTDNSWKEIGRRHKGLYNCK